MGLRGGSRPEGVARPVRGRTEDAAPAYRDPGGENPELGTSETPVNRPAGTSGRSAGEAEATVIDVSRWCTFRLAQGRKGQGDGEDCTDPRPNGKGGEVRCDEAGAVRYHPAAPGRN